MNRKVANDAIKKIAKKRGIKESEVREEIEKAILIGFINPDTRYKWNIIFGAGRLPSPEEFIMKIAGMVTK